MTAPTGAPRSRAAWLTRPLGRLMLAASGWRVEGRPVAPQCVMIVAPHTSSWDFVHGLAAKWALSLSVHFLAKKELFRFPLGGFLRAVGGLAVDRGSTDGLAERLTGLFASGTAVYVVITPEGTRGKVGAWKTGFHRIAVAAGVPIIPVALDYAARAVRVLPPYSPTGDYATDLAALARHFTPAIARHPEKYTTPTA